ncbi:hypothetical protein PSYMO_38443, partial [Pseudomonas amygdali pv. mori str. 301020]
EADALVLCPGGFGTLDEALVTKGNESETHGFQL